MQMDTVIELGREALLLALLVGAPVMGISIVVGLFISIIQAVTQIQDQTVSFVPKIVAMLLVMLWVLPWGLNLLIDYSTELFQNIPTRL